MAKAFSELDKHGDSATLNHAEWLGLLLDREMTHRHDKRLHPKNANPPTSTKRPSGGRDHPGTTGEIISVQTGGIIGIRTVDS